MAAGCVGSMILYLNRSMLYLHALHTASVGISCAYQIGSALPNWPPPFPVIKKAEL